MRMVRYFPTSWYGALIENLNDLDADVVFIKNIDNVVPDRLKDETISWKMIIAGKLVELQERTFAYLHKLEQGNCSRSELEEMADFLQKELSVRNMTGLLLMMLHWQNTYIRS